MNEGKECDTLDPNSDVCVCVCGGGGGGIKPLRSPW